MTNTRKIGYVKWREGGLMADQSLSPARPYAECKFLSLKECRPSCGKRMTGEVS